MTYSKNSEDQLKKKYELTDKHREQLKPWHEKWLKTVMSTQAMTEADKMLCREHVKGLYRAANLEPPPDQRIVFVSSPFILRFAGGFAAAIWYRRKKFLATSAATSDATRDATRDATSDAISAATWYATNDATNDATNAATSSATRIATWDATEDATEDATRDATWYATRAAIRAAIRTATSAATRDAIEAATWAATEIATSAATSDATGAATGNATGNAISAATWPAIEANNKKWFRFPIQPMVTLSKVLGLAEFGLNCANSAYNMWNGGNQWGGYVEFLSFFRHISGLPLDYSKWDHYEKLAELSGPRIMHEEFCMISDRPKILKVNESNQPHCDLGPFCEWRDGSGLFALNGVRVPEWLVMTKAEDLNPHDIMKLENAEQRKEGIRKIGIDRMREPLKVQIIDSWKDYELWSIEFEGRRIGPYLKMINDTTGQVHVEGCGEITSGGIDPNIKTCQEALAWRGGFSVYTNAEWTA
jgi:hypothetical protein